MALRNPAAVAAVFLVLLFIPSFVSAATGGRIGGSLFPSFSVKKESKSPSSSSSSSHSSPSPSSYSSFSSSSSDSSRAYNAPPSNRSTAAPSKSSSRSDNAGMAVLGVGVIIALIVISLVVIVCLAALWGCYTLAVKSWGNLSVVKLQVGLMGEGQSLQRDLNRITETANTSTPEGLSYVLTGAATALLDNLDHCISSYSTVIRKSEVHDVEACFNQFSKEERDKFDAVTLVKWNSFKTHSKSQSPNEIQNEYIVVTILVAMDGVLKLPSINGTRDLKKALHELRAISSSKIMAVEVLWTPQQENDTLTQKELLKRYPDLRGFYEAPVEGQYEDQKPFLGAK